MTLRFKVVELSKPLLAHRHRGTLVPSKACTRASMSHDPWEHRLSQASDPLPFFQICHDRLSQLQHARILSLCICHPGHHRPSPATQAFNLSPAKRSINNNRARHRPSCSLLQSPSSTTLL